MNDDLKATLSKLIQTGSWSNPAMSSLTNDYTKYHVVLVVVGGVLVIGFLLLALWFLRLWRKAAQAHARRWAFERTTYVSFSLLSAFVAVVLLLIVLVNATNVVDPRHGFSLLVDSLGIPRTGTPMASLYRSFNTWVQSGRASMPPLVQQKVHDRVVFHTTRALVAGIILVVCAALSVLIWRTLIIRSRVAGARFRLNERALLVSGVGTVGSSLLLLVVVVANMQGALASETLTLLYG